jgi:D-sedoheptulose 7-phosphate isomerase
VQGHGSRPGEGQQELQEVTVNIEQLSQRVDRHIQVVRKLADEAPTVQAVCDLLVTTFRTSHRLFLAGNGGSDCDAQHVAAELLVRLFHNRPAMPAVYLSAGGAVGSAIGNDFSFEEVFSRQIEGLLQRGDVFWAFSTSGKSRNILKAATIAKEKGGKVVLFTGPNPGPISQLADITLHAQGDRTDLVQEVHEIAYHYVCQQVESALLPENQQV